MEQFSFRFTKIHFYPFFEINSKRDSGKDHHAMPCSKELLIFNHLSKKLEDLLKDKVWAESKVRSVETEVDNLQICLENATQELKNKDEQIESINQALHLLEEDMVRRSPKTRITEMKIKMFVFLDNYPS